MDNQQVIVLVVGLLILSVFMFLPQWQARRRRQKQMEEIQVGAEVMTVGGIIGQLTYLNWEEHRARLEIAPGLEIQVVTAAISQVLAHPPTAEVAKDENENEDENGNENNRDGA